MGLGFDLRILWATFFRPDDIKRLSREYTQRIVGGIAMAWASLETALETIALVAYRTGGNHFSETMPRSLSRKIEFLRRSFLRLPNLQQYQERADDLLTRISKLSDDRHWAIHGAVMQNTREGDFESLVIQKAKRFDHYFEWETKEVTLSSLLEVWEQSNNLAVEVAQFGRPIFEQFLQDGEDNSTGA
ncbi:MAG TPA: hypothetical protein VHC40_08390 [Rhizomicrobium sp.]|nr:hypothetical protein [Rhizomicrobium sp.]